MANWKFPCIYYYNDCKHHFLSFDFLVVVKVLGVSICLKKFVLMLHIVIMHDSADIWYISQSISYLSSHADTRYHTNYMRCYKPILCIKYNLLARKNPTSIIKIQAKTFSIQPISNVIVHSAQYSVKQCVQVDISEHDTNQRHCILRATVLTYF